MGDNHDGPADVDGFWVNGKFYEIGDAILTTVAHVEPSQTVSNATPATPKSRGFSTNAPPKTGDTKPVTRIGSSWYPDNTE